MRFRLPEKGKHHALSLGFIAAVAAIFHHRQAHFRIGLLAFAADRYRLGTRPPFFLITQPSEQQ